MAAVLDPHRHPIALPPRPVRRPELRLLPGGAGAPAPRVASGPANLAGLGLDARAVIAGLLLLVLVMAGAVAIGRGALAGLAPAAPASSSSVVGIPPVGARTMVVRPGDSLWAIARRLQPTGDVRALVDQLVAANGGAVLQAGDRVAVPR